MMLVSLLKATLLVLGTDEGDLKDAPSSPFPPSLRPSLIILKAPLFSLSSDRCLLSHTSTGFVTLCVFVCVVVWCEISKLLGCWLVEMSMPTLFAIV